MQHVLNIISSIQAEVDFGLAPDPDTPRVEPTEVFDALAVVLCLLRLRLPHMSQGERERLRQRVDVLERALGR